MKQIQEFTAPKYRTGAYRCVEDGIYQLVDAPGESCVTSLSFVQEPELGEGSSAADIAQYPLESILDEYWCWVSDFYDDMNLEQNQVCHLEFTGEAEDLRRLRQLIGRHVYARNTGAEEPELVVE